MIAFLISMTSIPMLAGGPKVIANPSVKADAISVMELKAVFLEERNTLGDGSHVSPVLEKSGAAHAAFLREFLEQNDDNLQTHYRSLAFTGTGFIPKALESDNDVVVYVAKTRGAIGYVDSETNTRGVKTLTILRPNGGERALLVRVAPDYPDALQKRSIGGIVRLEITISSEGTVESARLLGGNPILAESAMDAVKGWKYSSARSRSNMEVTIPFNPSD